MIFGFNCFIFFFRLTSDIGVSYVAVGFFCLNRLTWFYSVGAEVFALNNLLIAVMMYLTVQFEKAVRESTKAGSDISVALRVCYSIVIKYIRWSICFRINVSSIRPYVRMWKIFLLYTDYVYLDFSMQISVHLCVVSRCVINTPQLYMWPLLLCGCFILFAKSGSVSIFVLHA